MAVSKWFYFQMSACKRSHSGTYLGFGDLGLGVDYKG